MAERRVQSAAAPELPHRRRNGRAASSRYGLALKGETRAAVLLFGLVLLALFWTQRASAHHLEISRLELRPIRAGELHGRLLLAPRTFEVQPGAATEALLSRLRATLELSVGGTPCPPRFELIELWTESSPSPGHLVDLRCAVASSAREVSVSLIWHDPSELLVTYPPTEATDPVSRLVGSGQQTTFVAREASRAVSAGGSPSPKAMPSARLARSSPPARGQLVWLGVHHVLPGGLDHVLFVIALALATFRHLGTLLARLLAFTVAHAGALYLGALGALVVPSALVEPLIAASIVLVALRAARTTQTPASATPARLRSGRASDWVGLASVALFGFVHGLGFADAFRALELDGAGLATALVAFHLGIEVAQLAVLGLTVVCLTFAVRAPWGQEHGRAERALSYAAWLTAISGAVLFFSRMLSTSS